MSRYKEKGNDRLIKKLLNSFLGISLLVFLMPITAWAMQIQVELTVNDNQNSITLEVEPTDRIEDVKQIVMDKTGTPVEDQALIFDGKVLEDGNSLQDYYIQNNFTLDMIVGRALDISRGNIVITDNGYSVGDGTEIAYQGRYIIYGETNQNTITIIGNTYDISFVSLNMRFTRSSDLLNIKSDCVYVNLVGENVLQATSDGSGSAITMVDTAVLHLDGNGKITLVGGSNYWGGSDAVSGGSLYINGGEATLIGGNKILNSYGHAFRGNALIITGGILHCGVGYLNDSNYASPTIFAPVQSFCGTLTNAGAHNLVYSENGIVITESCTNDCGHNATATLKSDADTYAYTGSEITPLVLERTTDWLGNINVVYENNINAGTANGTIEIGGVGITKTFEIIKATNQWTTEPSMQGWIYDSVPTVPASFAKFGTVSVKYTGNDYDNSNPPKDAGSYNVIFSVSGNDNYTALSKEIPFTIRTKEIGVSWGNREFTYDGTEKFPEIIVDGVVVGDNLHFDCSGGAINASDAAYTAKIIGISGEKASNYQLPASGLTCDFIINKAQQNAPALAEFIVTDESISGKRDGKIGGLTTAMEYSKEENGEYIQIAEPENMTFASGTYYVRYAANTNYEPSAPTIITIGAGDKIAVTFVADGQIVDTAFVDYGADVDMTEIEQIPAKEGHDKIAPYWNNDGKNITEATTITAVYTVNKYIVTYKADGKIVERIEVVHGEKITMPEVPQKEGYIGSWDKVIDTVTEDITIEAVYTSISSINVQEPPEIEPSKTESPKTGDNTSTGVWYAIIFVSIGSLFGLILLEYIRKQKSNPYL